MTDVRVLSAADVAQVVSLPDLLPVAERAFVKQGRGEVERPSRPHFPVGVGRSDGDGDGDDGDGGDPQGTGLVMPAYIHGDETYATKLAAVHPGNADRGHPTVNAQIVVSDADTGLPRAFLHGNRVTNARTGCIGGLAARELGASPVRLGVFGAGAQARWQTRAVAAATDLASVRVYSPSDSRESCAADLRAELGDHDGEGGDSGDGAVDVRAVDSPEAALADANVVVTATTASAPVFPGSALEPGTLVVAVGAYTAETRELDAETFSRAARVFADVPEEVAEIGDLRGTGLDVDDLLPLSDVFEGIAGREAADEILVVESVGTAVLDAAAAARVVERAAAAGVGTGVEL